jgi:hypothetical protein
MILSNNVHVYEVQGCRIPFILISYFYFYENEVHHILINFLQTKQKLLFIFALFTNTDVYNFICSFKNTFLNFNSGKKGLKTPTIFMNLGQMIDRPLPWLTGKSCHQILFI